MYVILIKILKYMTITVPLPCLARAVMFIFSVQKIHLSLYFNFEALEISLSVERDDALEVFRRLLLLKSGAEKCNFSGISFHFT